VFDTAEIGVRLRICEVDFGHCVLYDVHTRVDESTAAAATEKESAFKDSGIE
jgi:hypothetical protein